MCGKILKVVPLTFILNNTRSLIPYSDSCLISVQRMSIAIDDAFVIFRIGADMVLTFQHLSHTHTCAFTLSLFPLSHPFLQHVRQSTWMNFYLPFATTHTYTHLSLSFPFVLQLSHSLLRHTLYCICGHGLSHTHTLLLSLQAMVQQHSATVCSARGRGRNKCFMSTNVIEIFMTRSNVVINDWLYSVGNSCGAFSAFLLWTQPCLSNSL